MLTTRYRFYAAFYFAYLEDNTCVYSVKQLLLFETIKSIKYDIMLN